MSENPRIGRLNPGGAEEYSGTDDLMPPLGMGDLDSEHGIVLKDWSAQDFSNIYVRFRPHLISHARKFLREQSQAEEVVQDAFLYLMTALPELDSELGVLRFLKWKTKMLCLDMIRASRGGINNKLVPLTDDVPDDNEPHDSLVRADDAAIIGLAMAKLNPRHREVLIATIYEEKSHDEVAEQMGVSENALRQLLFRARTSFRQALVGQAQMEGKSLGEILTAAARKAASTPSTFLLGLIIMTSVVLPPILSTESPTSQEGQSTVAAAEVREQLAPEKVDRETIADATLPLDENRSGIVPGSEVDEVVLGEFSVEENHQAPKMTAGADSPSQENYDADAAKEAREAFNQVLGESLVTELASRPLDMRASPGRLTVTNESGLSADFAVDLSTQKVVQFLLIEFESDGHLWKAVPGNSLSVVEIDSGNIVVSFAATDFLVGDFSGQFDYVSTTESIFSRSGIKLDFVLDGDGELVSSTVAFLPKI